MVTLLAMTDVTAASKTGLAPFAKVVNVEKLVPPNMIDEDTNNVTNDLIDYVTPLIGDELLDYTRLKGQA